MPRRLLLAGLIALPLLLLCGCEKRIREAGTDRVIHVGHTATLPPTLILARPLDHPHNFPSHLL